MGFISVPLAELGLGFALCLAISALGWRRIDWFISLGYGFSIAAQAVLFPLLHLGSIDLWSGLQSALLLAYGLRLGLYLASRERSPSFARELEASKARGTHIKGAVKAAIWISVSALYVTMYSPALLVLTAGGGASIVGIVVMALGLGIEATADAQKAAFKAQHPARFCDVGLYRLVRCPNYFGEMVFWLGTAISGLAAYRLPGDWLIAAIGLVCIELIMLGSARRLELKQAERYGDDAAYREYVRTVPVLFPLVPLYSLKKLRVYLG